MIGANVFIGMNSIILMGTVIGENSIVGAGSVCSGHYPPNSVIAGNPARVIRTLDEHYALRKKRTVLEAIQCAKMYCKRYGKFPLPKDLAGFKWLFTPRSYEVLNSYEVASFQCSGDEPKEVEQAFFKTEPYWQDFDSFRKEVEEVYCKENMRT